MNRRALRSQFAALVPSLAAFSTLLATLVRGMFALVFALCSCRAALAQPGPDGIDWVTIGAPGNHGYDRDDPNGRTIGRGAVPYEYRIGRFEITTSQWLEFINTFKAREDFIPDTSLARPVTWGAEIDPDYSGSGVRYRLRGDPSAGMWGVGGITWREAARYCNWLCNGKSSDLSAIANGAYDVSTFGDLPGRRFTDQPSHNPGALYWIPTWDEWLKSVHFDPSKNGPGQGGWWLRPHGSDEPLIYGPPGVGQANSGWRTVDRAEWMVPLGAYDTRTPFGLIDAAGGTREWTETILDTPQEMARILDGSAWGGNDIGADWAYGFDGWQPRSRFAEYGFRIASAVPSSSTLWMLGIGALVWSRRCRAQENLPCEPSSCSVSRRS